MPTPSGSGSKGPTTSGGNRPKGPSSPGSQGGGFGPTEGEQPCPEEGGVPDQGGSIFGSPIQDDVPRPEESIFEELNTGL